MFNEYKNLYKDCYVATHFCEYCGGPAVGYCNIRNKYVCENHRYFTDSDGNSWKCPH
jgi:hypothetical protein